MPISRAVSFISKTTLMTFKPPAVEPAQEPMIISKNNMIFDRLGHRSKSAEENPVVEMMEDTWKNEYLNPCPRLLSYRGLMLNAMTVTATAESEKYTINS